MAGDTAANVLFRAALLVVGGALLLGIAIRPAAGGAALTILMWPVALPPDSNPFMDDHLIYAAVLIVPAPLGAGDALGLGRVRAVPPLVRRARWLGLALGDDLR